MCAIFVTFVQPWAEVTEKNPAIKNITLCKKVHHLLVCFVHLLQVNVLLYHSCIILNDAGFMLKLTNTKERGETGWLLKNSNSLQQGF